MKKKHIFLSVILLFTHSLVSYTADVSARERKRTNLQSSYRNRSITRASGSQALLENIRNQLGSRSKKEQAAALRKLEGGKFNNIEFLLDLYGWQPDSKKWLPRNNRLRSNAAYLLGETKNTSVVPALIAGISHDNSSVRLECIRALAKIGDPRPVPLLNSLLVNKSYEPKLISFALSELRHPSSINSLITVIGGKDWPRISSHVSLINIGADAVEPLIKALSKEKDLTRKSLMIFSLGELRDPRAVPLLSSTIRTGKPSIQKQCLLALRKIASPEAIEVIKSFTKIRRKISKPINDYAKRLLDDFKNSNPQEIKQQALKLKEETGSGKMYDRSERLYRLEKLIESYDIDFATREWARDEAFKIRPAYNFKGKPNTWDSLVFIIANIDTTVTLPNGKSKHIKKRLTREQIIIAKQAFSNITKEIYQASQGRLNLKLHFRVNEQPFTQLVIGEDGTLWTSKETRRKLVDEMRTLGFDHVFCVWSVDDDKDYNNRHMTNNGPFSNIMVPKPEKGITGPLHELLHSINNALKTAGYEFGQKPELHYGISRISLKAKRLAFTGTDSTRIQRLRIFMLRNITSNMWASVSRNDVKSD